MVLKIYFRLCASSEIDSLGFWLISDWQIQYCTFYFTQVSCARCHQWDVMHLLILNRRLGVEVLLVEGAHLEEKSLPLVTGVHTRQYLRQETNLQIKPGPQDVESLGRLHLARKG